MTSDTAQKGRICRCSIVQSQYVVQINNYRLVNQPIDKEVTKFLSSTSCVLLQTAMLYNIRVAVVVFGKLISDLIVHYVYSQISMWRNRTDQRFHFGFGWFGFWCLTPLSTIFQWRSVIGGRNRSTRRKSPTCRKSLTNFITQCFIAMNGIRIHNFSGDRHGMHMQQ